MKVLNSSVLARISMPRPLSCCWTIVTMSTRSVLSTLVLSANENFRPSLSRISSPSVSLQPAAARSARALSGSNG